MVGWRKAVGTLALTLIVLMGLVPGAHAAPNYYTALSNDGHTDNSHAITRLSRAFYSRGVDYTTELPTQDSLVIIVHNRQPFAVGRLDIYSNVADTVRSIKVTEHNTAIANIDEVQIWLDNGDGIWDPNSDTQVAGSTAGLAFTGSAGSDSIANFTYTDPAAVAAGLVVPAQAAWTVPGNMQKAGPHLSVFVVYKTAQQVFNGTGLRAYFQSGSNGITLGSRFADPSYISGIFADGTGATLVATMQDDAATAGPTETAATYTVSANVLGNLFQADYSSPTLGFYNQPALHHATAGDTNVPIVRFELTTPHAIGVAANGPNFGRQEASNGNVRDTLRSITVTSENTADIDVKTIKLWVKANSNFTNVDSVQVTGTPDTLLGTSGGVAGTTPFVSGKATINLSTINALVPDSTKRYLLTYELNAQGQSHDNDVLDLKISQFDISSSRTGYTPPNDALVDNAKLSFESLPFTVWIDTLQSQRGLHANSVPDRFASGDRLKVWGTIDIGDSTYGGGKWSAPELAQVKVKNATSDIDSLIVDLRAFGHGMRYSLAKSGWRPLGTDSVWADTFAVIDPTHGVYNDAYGYSNQFSLDKYAADNVNRPYLNVSNGNTGFLAEPEGPYTIASGPAAGAALPGMAFPKWYAYRHDLNNVVVVDSGWAPTGFPGDKYAGPYTQLPVDTWLPNRVTNVHFANLDSGKVNIQFNPVGADKLTPYDASQIGGPAAFLIYAQANWTSGTPSGDIDWSHAVDTIPYTEYNGGSPYINVNHQIRDLWGGTGNPATHVVKFNDGQDYLFGVRARDNKGNLELNQFPYSDVADTLGPIVNIVSPTRQCGIYGPEHTFLIYAVVDSTGHDINANSVQLHFRLKDIDPSTDGDQPGPWDDTHITVNELNNDYSGVPVPMQRIGQSYWYTSEIDGLSDGNDEFWNQDNYQYTVTATDNSGNTETPDHAYNRVNNLLQGGLNHVCVIWDHVAPVCELILINGQETSSAQLPVVDSGNDSTSISVRVTDAVNDHYGLAYFVRFRFGNQASGPGHADLHTVGWLTPVNHVITFNYPTAAAVAVNPVVGGVTGTAQISVTDSARNECSSTAEFFLHDLTAPSAYFTYPITGTRLALPYDIHVNATDNACLGAAVFLLYDHATGNFLDTIGIAPHPEDAARARNKAGIQQVSQGYDLYWDKSISHIISIGLADGAKYDIHAVVYDCAGNTYTATTTFTYDGLAPTLKLEIVDPLVQNGHVVVSNGNTVSFKATPVGAFSNDVRRARFYFKEKSAADDFYQYTQMGTVNTQRDGAYWLDYSAFPFNDSIDVRVIGYDAAGNVAFDSDNDHAFDPATLSKALLPQNGPSAVVLYTIPSPDWALANVTDVTTGQTYYPSSKLNSNPLCAYATGADSLYIQPQDNSQAQNTAFVEYRLSGPGLGSSTGSGSATIQLGHVNTSPYNFGFSLASITGLQEYLKVWGYWTGTLTMRVYDLSGSYSDVDAICLGVTNTTASQACIYDPLPACTVYGDVTVSAVVLNTHQVRKVRFEYQDRANSGAWIPFDSSNTAECGRGDSRGSRVHPSAAKGGLGCTQTYTGIWHTRNFNLSDGTYGLRAVAIDSAGHIDSAPLSEAVTLDNHGPTVALGAVPAWVGGGTAWLNPTTGNSIYPVLHLSASVTGGTPNASVTFQVKLATDDPTNPSSWTTLGTDLHAPYVLDYVFNNSNRNFWLSHFGGVCGVNFRAVVNDDACGSGRDAFDVSGISNVDFNAPVCYFTAVNGTPVNGSNTLPTDVTSGTSVPLVAGAWDRNPTTALNVGLDSVSYTVNNGWGQRVFDVAYGANSAVNGLFTVYWNTTGLTPGQYTVNFKAWDLLHNFCSSSVTVQVIDNVAPIASVCAITDRHVLAISYDQDVNDITFQMRPQGGPNWTSVGIASQIYKGRLSSNQAKAMGRRVYRKLASGNVPVTLWSTDFVASSLSNATYEFRAIARDTANNSNPSLAPLTAGTVAVSNGVATWSFAKVDQLKSMDFTASDVTCDSAIVKVVTDGSCGIPGVVSVQRAINKDANDFFGSLVAMHQNTINATTFFGSVDMSYVDNGGTNYVFACCQTGPTTVSLIQAGVVYSPVTPSLGSNSTFTSVDGYMNVYVQPGTVNFSGAVGILPTDMPLPQPDDNRIRGVGTPAGTIECFGFCASETRGARPTGRGKFKTQEAPFFSKPIQIGLKYGTPVGANTTTGLAVARWDYSNNRWDFSTILRSTIDPTTNTATALVTDQGCYAVVEKDETCTPGTLTITDVRPLPGEASFPAGEQVPLNSGYVDSKPCFSANIQETFTNSDNVKNVEVWLRPVGGNYIKLYDLASEFIHCGLDHNSGYVAGSGFLNVCYEVQEEEGCHDVSGTDDGAFPALKTGNYQLKIRATTVFGHCQTVETTFNVDDNGPVVTNLTPAYQGNNPVISYSAKDVGAGVSQKWQAVDVFVQEFDRDAAALKAPVYKGTYYLGNGIVMTAHADTDGVRTGYYSLKTNFDLKQGDHLRAVVYGGQGTDWYESSNVDDLFYGTRQYHANGGVRDSLNNAAGPVEVNTTIDFGGTSGPNVHVTSLTCLGANPVVVFTVDTTTAGIDWSTLTITYTDLTNNKQLGVHTYSNVTVQGNVVTDATSFNLANGTHVQAVIHVADKGAPRGERNVTYDFTVDATAPVITLAAGAAQTDAKIALDVAGTDCSGNFDVDWNTVVVTVDGVTKSSEGDYTVDQNLRRITVNNPGYGKTLVVTVADKAGNIGRYSAVTQSGTLGFGSGSGAPHNYPNPFNNNSGSTTIALGLTKSANVDFKIFDLAGNLVKSWANVSATPATTLTWDGRDDQGRIVARGVYLGRIKATDGSHTAATIMKIAVSQ